jgi:hypothetical protein
VAEGATQDLLLQTLPVRQGGEAASLSPQTREADSRRTHFGAVVGTPQYMAPEVAAGGSAKCSAAVDIYGLGTLLYELLCGHAPFPTDGATAVVHLRTGAEPAPVRALLQTHPRIPEALVEVCERAMHRDPCARYADAAALGEDKLRDALAWALSRVPAYREYEALAKDLADPHAVLASLPLTSKDQLRTDLPRLAAALAAATAAAVVAVVTTTSCFAPRAPDDVLAVAQLCAAAFAEVPGAIPKGARRSCVSSAKEQRTSLSIARLIRALVPL